MSNFFHMPHDAAQYLGYKGLVTNAVAFCIDHLLHPLRQSSTETLDVVVLINIVADLTQAFAKLCRCLGPWGPRPGHLLPVANPSHRGLMQEHFLQAAWLSSGVIPIECLQGALPQSLLELWRYFTVSDAPKPLPTVYKQRSWCRSGLKPFVQGAADFAS